MQVQARQGRRFGFAARPAAAGRVAAGLAALAVVAIGGLVALTPPRSANAADTPPPAEAAPAPAAAPAAPTAAPAPAPAPVPASKANPAALEPLAFMAGCWEGEQDGVRSEECWLAPAAGLMVGMHRDVFKNGRTMFEFLRIEAQETGVVYLASPRGAPATAFAMVSAQGNRVEFTNPMHDYPRRILYWADGRDKLKAAVEGPGKGKPTREEWTWTRRK